MTDVLERAASARSFTCPLDVIQVRDSGDPNTAYTIRGHAAVFDALSLDLGGFREKIDPGAFTNALSRSPDVLGVWDHDTRYILGRTQNETLDLEQDDTGLAFFDRVAPTSYAADLRILLERGDISQCSFMFTIERERYEFIGDGEGREILVFTIEEVGELYDITVCGRGAYPQTDVSLARSARVKQATELLEARRAAATPAETSNEDDSERKARDHAHRAAVARASLPLRSAR